MQNRIKIKHIILTIGIFLIILLLIGLILDYHHRFCLILSQPHFNRKILIRILRHYKSYDVILIFSIVILSEAIPGLPVSVIEIISGIFLGRNLGFLINVLGMIIGNIISMLVIEHFGLSKLSKKHSKIAKKITEMKHPLIGLTIGYIVPMIPTIFANYAAAKLKLKWKNLIMCMIIGAIPSAWLYACGGDAFLLGNNKIGIIAIISVFLLTTLVIFIHYGHKKYNKKYNI